MKRSDGGYIDVPYMSDAVLVNLGALMQQWTSDKYQATVRPVGVFPAIDSIEHYIHHFFLNKSSNQVEIDCC